MSPSRPATDSTIMVCCPQQYYLFHIDGVITISPNVFSLNILPFQLEQPCEVEFITIVLEGCLLYFHLWGLNKLYVIAHKCSTSRVTIISSKCSKCTKITTQSQ